jgi:predicted PhzF superfamily epimerase YddE/YHI9
MDFPASPPAEIEASSATGEALGAPVEWTGRTDDDFYLLALLTDERSVRSLSPDLTAVGELGSFAVIATAVADAGEEFDFVSRLFAPKVGIPEDPVTGGAHTVLAPFWAGRLGRIAVELNGDRVTIMGRAITVVSGALSSAAKPN